jgi:hypothetical protein
MRITSKKIIMEELFMMPFVLNAANHVSCLSNLTLHVQCFVKRAGLNDAPKDSGEGNSHIRLNG